MEKSLMIPRAHGKVYQAIKRGELTNLKTTEVKCVDCGRRATCYDHRDYRKPLEVDPVCRRCNVARGSGKPFLSKWNWWNVREHVLYAFRDGIYSSDRP